MVWFEPSCYYTNLPVEINEGDDKSVEKDLQMMLERFPWDPRLTETEIETELPSSLRDDPGLPEKGGSPEGGVAEERQAYGIVKLRMRAIHHDTIHGFDACHGLTSMDLHVR